MKTTYYLKIATNNVIETHVFKTKYERDQAASLLASCAAGSSITTYEIEVSNDSRQITKASRSQISSSKD